jgi:hypothetical protein
MRNPEEDQHANRSDKSSFKPGRIRPISLAEIHFQHSRGSSLYQRIVESFSIISGMPVSNRLVYIQVVPVIGRMRLLPAASASRLLDPAFAFEVFLKEGKRSLVAFLFLLVFRQAEDMVFGGAATAHFSGLSFCVNSQAIAAASRLPAAPNPPFQSQSQNAASLRAAPPPVPVRQLVRHSL